MTVTRPLSTVVSLLRSGRVSSADLVEECLHRIGTERRVNAVVEVDADEARRQAMRADDLLRNGSAEPAPCLGVPVTVKRTFEVDGFVHTEHDVTAGEPHGVPQRDADVVRRLRVAGAVIVGRTNAPARTGDIDTWHPEFGRTAHPLDAGRGAGGSSGGSAAAVAAGHTAFDIGSDAAGSARIPAHSCGVFALRPTPGLLSPRGHVPGEDPTRMLTVCPITRSAKDLRYVWHALGPWPVPPPSRRLLAVALPDPAAPLSDEVAESLRASVAVLRSAGYDIEDVAVPVSLRDNWLLCQQLLFVQDRPAGELLSDVDSVDADAEPMEIALWSAAMSPSDRQRLYRRRAVFRSAWRRFFTRYAALLAPVMATTALPARDVRIPVLADRVVIGGREMPMFSLSAWCALASVSGLPAVSVPVVPAGLPVGMQVISAPGTDGALVDLVTELAAVVGPGVRTEVPSVIEQDEKSAAVLAVDTAGDYLAQVTRWLSGRTAYGAPLAADAVQRRRLAEATIAHRAARALLDRGFLGAAVSSSVSCVRACEAVHAGAGVFDAAPDAVHELFLERRWDSAHPAPLSRLSPELAEQVAFALIQEPTGMPRRLAAVVGRVCPPTSTTLLDDLVTAEVMACLLAPGVAARVMTHRQVVRSYLSGPHAASNVLADVTDRQSLTAIAVTEPHAGSDLSALRTEVRRNGVRLLLDGVKTYVTGGADSDWVLVAARFDARPALVWVDTRRPGVSRRPLTTRAWRGAGFAELRLRSYEVSEDDFHRGRGAETLLTGLVRERMILAAQQVGYARRWLADVPPAARPGLTRSLAAAQVLLEEAATPDPPSMVDSSMAKIACCEVATDIAVARAEALVGRAALEELLDDQASARACAFAGGTMDVNLAIVEGVLVSALNTDRRLT